MRDIRSVETLNTTYLRGSVRGKEGMSYLSIVLSHAKDLGYEVGEMETVRVFTGNRPGQGQGLECPAIFLSDPTLKVNAAIIRRDGDYQMIVYAPVEQEMSFARASEMH